MTYEAFMDSPTKTREEKLVLTYDEQPHVLSRGIYSLIDAFVHATPKVRERLAKSVPEYDEAVRHLQTGALAVEL